MCGTGTRDKRYGYVIIFTLSILLAASCGEIHQMYISVLNHDMRDSGSVVRIQGEICTCLQVINNYEKT